MTSSDHDLSPEDCLEYAPGQDCSCSGPVTFHMREPDPSLGVPAGSFPRCEHHAQLWHERAAETRRKYGGVAPPSGFDPGYAGERWDDDY